MKILGCRRSKIAILSILCLTGLGFYTKDASSIAMAISGVAVGIAGANAWEGRNKEAK